MTRSNMPFCEKIIERIYYQTKEIPDIYKLIRISKVFLEVYRNLDINCLLNKSNNKDEKYRIYINFYKHLPKQGSILWLEHRKGNKNLPPVIGGSDMKDLIKSPKLLAERKLITQKFIENIHTRWGNLFEEVIAFICDFLFETQSSETGSIPGLKDENGNVIQGYSPDRIMNVNKDKLKSVLFSDFNKAMKSFIPKYLEFHESSDEKVIILNEFKCPTTRIPNGTVPNDYIYQPPTGACTIPIIDMSLFIDSAFRKCSIDDFEMNNKYDVDFHFKDESNIPGGFDSPLFMGIIGIYEVGNSMDDFEEIIDNEKINNMSIILAENIINDILCPGSDCHGIKLEMSNLVSLIFLCNKFLTYMLNFKNILSREKIIFATINKLIQIPADLPELVLKLITDTINVENSIRYKNINYYGMDLGSISGGELDRILMMANQRSNGNSKYRIYYNPGIIISPFILDELKMKVPNIIENYMDPTLSSREQCQKWIFKNIKYFTDFCSRNNYHPIGVLPWKLFKLCIVPIFNDPNFLNQYKDNIAQAVEIIQAIKQKAKLKFANMDIDNNTIDEFYKKELDLIYYPSKRAKSRAESVCFNKELINSFNEL